MLNLQDYITQSRLYRTYEAQGLQLVEYHCLADEEVSDIWTHQDYFAYVLDGRKKWQTPDNAVEAGKGDILFVRKGATTVYQYFDRPFTVIFLFLPRNFVHSILRDQPAMLAKTRSEYLDNEQLLLLEKNEVLHSNFEALRSYFYRDGKLSEPVLILKSRVLVLDLLNQPGNYRLKRYFRNLMEGGGAPLREVMQSHFMKPLDITSFARLCGRSLSSFRRDFRREFHTTPGKWLLKRRLKHSRHLLETTDDRISEVLYASGFTNRAHFNKAFKEHFGLAPNECRPQPTDR